METRQRILEVFKRQFKSSDLADLGLPFDELRMGAVEEWDSLGNLNFLLQIESEFSVRLTTEELASIDSLVQIEDLLGQARHSALMALLTSARRSNDMLDKLAQVLEAVGVGRGDHVLIYSNTASIAKIADLRSLTNEFGASAREEILARFHSAFRSAVGEHGTLLTLGRIRTTRDMESRSTLTSRFRIKVSAPIRGTCLPRVEWSEAITRQAICSRSAAEQRILQ